MTIAGKKVPPNPVFAILRIDRSPMNARVWIAQIDCPKKHDVYRYRKPRMTQKLECEKCQK